jgi:hypothetical protein
MHHIRNKLTYANVMSSIAVFLVLGGATAFAASQVGRNSVGTKQLKRNAVTSAKLKRNAVTAPKIRAGSVTAAKIRNGVVGASKIKAGAITGQQLAANSVGNPQSQLVKVFKGSTVPAASNPATAPRVELGSVGPFKFYGTCARSGELVVQQTFIELSGGSAVLSRPPNKEEFNYLTPASPPEQRSIHSSLAAENKVDTAPTSSFAASASDGAQVTGTVAGTAKAGNPAIGNGPFPAGDACIIGPLTVFGG